MKLFIFLLFIMTYMTGFSQETQFKPSRDIIQIHRFNQYYLTFHKDSTCTFTPYLNNARYQIAYFQDYNFKLKEPINDQFSIQFLEKHKENSWRNIIGGMQYETKILQSDSTLHLYDKGNTEFLNYVNTIIDSIYINNNLKDSLYNFYLNIPDRNINKFWNTEENIISVKMFESLKNDKNNSPSFRQLLCFIQKKYYNKEVIEMNLKRIRNNYPEISLSDELTFLWSDKICFTYPTLHIGDDKANQGYNFKINTLTSLKELIKNNKFTFKYEDNGFKKLINISIKQ